MRAGGDDARAARGELPVDDAVLADDAGEEHFRDHFDDPGAADARDSGAPHRLLEPRLIGPQVRPDHLEARLEGRRVDAHALDRPGRGALAAADLRALEGRSRGAGAGEQPAAVAEHDLRVGADVHQQRELIGQVGALGEDDAGGIRADVAGDAGQGVDARAGIEVQADLARLEAQGFIGSEREGRAAELHRIDAEQQVVHDRVADHRHLEEVGYCDLRPRAPRRRRGVLSAPRTASVICCAPPGCIIE